MTGVDSLDDETIELITERVVAALRDELRALALAVIADKASRPLTVGEVADRLGVARSTVYAHWRQWGGYKLGPGEKAPIRFDESRLPCAPRMEQSDAASPGSARRRRRELLQDNPRTERFRSGYPLSRRS